MLLPSLPLFGLARSGLLQLPGLFSSSDRLALAPHCLSAAAYTALIGFALLLVWIALRRTS